MVRALAIDLGSRRIGVAISDGWGLSAQPLKTIDRHGGQRDLDNLAVLIRQYEVQQLVVGLPLNPDPRPGLPEEGRAARGARAFALRLQAAFGLPVDLVDESFSTVEAESVLLEADLSRARRKQVVDRVAAAVILQRWLDRNR
jgi:putative holliday junction resolvase